MKPSLSPPEAEVLDSLRALPVLRDLAESELRELSQHFERRNLTANEVLFSKGERADALYLILRGKLDAVVSMPGRTELVLSTMGPGSTVGEVAIFFGGRRTATVRANTESMLGRLSRDTFEKLRVSHADILKRFHGVTRERLRRDQLVELLPKLFGSVDGDILKELAESIEWIQISRGERLFAQGEEGDCVYFNVSGRLRAIDETDESKPRILGELPRGEIIGEMALFTGAPRSASVYAVRDSELARIDSDAFERLMRSYPQLLRSLTKTMAKRLQPQASSTARRARIVNLAVVPLGSDVPAGDFARRLVATLAETSKTVHVDRSYMTKHLGPEAVELSDADPFNLWVRTWLEQLESHHRFVIYEADAHNSLWSQRAIRQADLVLLVGSGSGDPQLSEVEQHIVARESDLTAPRRWLVLLHPDGHRFPTGTSNWLENRHLELHHHLRWPSEEDLARLGRFLRGRAVGLVLGGGGARGIAHIGVLRALEESGVAIDFVGGTSIGGLFAMGYAMGKDVDRIERDARHVFVHRNPFRRFTLPIVSLISPTHAKRVVKEVYGNARLEDSWLNCFCVACDISTGETVVLREGPAWRAALATSAVPGVSVPVVYGKSLLVDGGVVDNLPGPTMKKLCGGRLILVDVSPETDLSANGEDIPGAFKILLSWLLPHRQSIRVPTIGHVIVRLTTISSVRGREEARRLAMLFFQPPVQNYAMLEFSSFDEIMEVGLRHGREEIARWKDRRRSDADAADQTLLPQSNA